MSKILSLDKNQVEDILNLTSLQEGMLYHFLNDVNKDLYFIQLRLDINGEIDIIKFEESWQHVVNNNEMLRSIFRWESLDLLKSY